MKRKYVLLTAGAVFGLLVASSLPVMGKAEYGKKEKKACKFCHVDGKPKELNEAGKYYKEKKTLEGYKEAAKPAKPAK